MRLGRQVKEDTYAEDVSHELDNNVDIKVPLSATKDLNVSLALERDNRLNSDVDLGLDLSEDRGEYLYRHISLHLHIGVYSGSGVSFVCLTGSLHTDLGNERLQVVVAGRQNVRERRELASATARSQVTGRGETLDGSNGHSSAESSGAEGEEKCERLEREHCSWYKESVGGWVG